jgi:uncharacterized membrane protein YcaP (DUF421 family)
MDKNIEIFDWKRIFFSEDHSIAFLGEIAIRTIIMFLILIIALKFLSKRGVKQLSVFELAILIALGSATGDPMFYNHVPVLYGIAVIIVVIWLYKIITTFTAKSKTIEIILEGKPTCLLKNGKIEFKNYKKIGLPYDKFFAELRLKGIDHLGQVKKAYLETSGEISLYYFEDDEVQPGLPIYPETIDNPITGAIEKKSCACIYCGNIQTIQIQNDTCQICSKNKWLEPMSNKRIK